MTNQGLGPRNINVKYLDYLNKTLYNPLPSPSAMLPYYSRPLANIFSIPPSRTYPGRDMLPHYVPMRGDIPTLPGTSFPINDVVLSSIHFGKDGVHARFQMMGYSPADIRVVAQYAQIEVVATKSDPLSGSVRKETRQILPVPFPIVEYELQTGVEVDGVLAVFVPWRIV